MLSWGFIACFFEFEFPQIIFAVMTVTERRCGSAEEVSGCTLYKSMRSRRHFVAGSSMDVSPRHGGIATASAALISHRRRETGPLVVEVCNGGCQTDGCVSGAAGTRIGIGRRTAVPLIFLAFFMPSLAFLFDGRWRR